MCVISHLVKQPPDNAVVALFLLTHSQLRVDPMPARALLPGEVSDPIETIDSFKMILALEEGSKKTTSASKVAPFAAVSWVSTTAASVTPF